jgi:hypothetical protein
LCFVALAAGIYSPGPAKFDANRRFNPSIVILLFNIGHILLLMHVHAAQLRKARAAKPLSRTFRCGAGSGDDEDIKKPRHA